MSGTADLVVLAKEPLPGRVKTRLTSRYTPAQAALIAEAALLDTLDAVSSAQAARRSLVLDGSPGPWIPDCVQVVQQRGDGLDERLANAFDDVYQDRPVVLIGMDTPQVTPGLLRSASAALDAGHDAVFGPAADGGFWLLGLRTPDPALLLGVPMSCPETGAAQLERLHTAGLSVALLPRLVDVDTPADALRVARQAPGGRFAATVEALTSVSADAG